MANDRRGFLNLISEHLLGSVIVVAVLMLVIPLNQPIIDVLMAANFALAIIILLIVVNTSRPANFSTFPRVVEFATLFGLGINIASTRLILSGVPKLSAGGSIRGQSLMVQGFANIVAGGDLVIGFVIFVILIVVQILVFTKGATRVAEVQARFQLDAMNTKRFDIDSQLQSGEITSEEAKRLKDELSREIDFYSNMDGSSKFVSGNVKAGVFITIINLVGGFAIGVMRNHLSWGDCLKIYTTLTIGDGLISQMPSLVLSFATGLLITGNKTDSGLDAQLKNDFTVSGRVYTIAGAALILIGFGIAIPNDSWALFGMLAVLGGLLIFSGYRMTAEQKANFAKKLAEEQEKKAQNQTGGKVEDVSKVVPLDPISLELGYALIPLVDKEKGAELLGRITQIRTEAAIDLGLVVPKIRIIDNTMLNPDEYSIKIRGNEASRYRVKPGFYLCMDFGNVVEKVPGEETKDPCFGAPSVWVSEEDRSRAEQNGYSVFDSSTVIATHLTEIIRSHAAEILRRKEVSEILEKVKETNPVVVEEVTKAGFTIGDIEEVLQGLLREQVSIRDIETILETLSKFGAYAKNPWFLIEKVRQALGLQICMQYVDRDAEIKKLSVLRLSETASENILSHQVVPNDGGEPFVGFSPEEGRKWITSVSGAITQVSQMSYLPIILCAGEVRQLVKSSIEREMPGTVVISIQEVMKAGNNVQLEVLGDINVDE